MRELQFKSFVAFVLLALLPSVSQAYYPSRNTVTLPVCPDCEKQVPISDCEIRTVSGDYHVMHFFYCPKCARKKSSNRYTGRIVDHNHKELMYSTSGGEWG
ncbi:hypothetical protein KKF34_16130 [Myxococcota bacterium]|nr:hypothetical protein [Myxococcota bacterium]MBU1382718.1 hypothetical protein [Myxococcota bacterium]MBU1498405.1 hypothetical protein [Myxococcota bacterium]